MANYGVKFNKAGSVSIPSWSSGMGAFSVSVRCHSSYVNGVQAILGTVDASYSSNHILINANSTWTIRMGGTNVVAGLDAVITSNLPLKIDISRDDLDNCVATITRTDTGAVLATRTFNRGGLLTFTRIGTTNTDPLYLNGVVWEVELIGDGTSANDHRHYKCSDNTDTEWIDIESGQNGTFSGGLAAGTAKFELDSYVETDTTIPVITLVGDNPVQVQQGATYTDAGATASDNNDGNITANIVVTGTVDTSTVGAYTLSYNVDDAASNSAVQKQRVVNVVNNFGTINTLPIGLNNKQLRLDESVTSVDVYDTISGELIVRKTGLSTHATTGVITLDDALMTVSEDYDIRVVMSDGAQSIKRYTAS